MERLKLLYFRVCNFITSNMKICIQVILIVLSCVLAAGIIGFVDVRFSFGGKEYLSLVKIDVSEVFAIIAVIISLFALFFTKKINASTFIASFWARYWSLEMLNAIRVVAHKLREVVDNNYPNRNIRTPQYNPNGRIVVAEKKPKCSFLSKEQDDARRMIKGYYFNILSAYETGIISHGDLCKLCNSSAYVLMFDVIEAMEQVINVNYDFKPFYKLMLITSSIYREVKKNAPRGKPLFCSSK